VIAELAWQRKRIAVRRPSRRARKRSPGRARAVIDDELLAERFRQALRERRINTSTVLRRESHEYATGSPDILRLSASQEQNETADERR